MTETASAPVAPVTAAVFLVDPRSVCVWLNAVAERLTGVSAEQVRAQAVPIDVLLRDARGSSAGPSAVGSLVAAAVRRGTAWAGEYPFATRAGAGRPAWCRVSPLSGSGGLAGAIVEVDLVSPEAETRTTSCDDPSQALRQLAEFDALYAAMPAGLCQFDLELRFRRINPALAFMNGLSIEQHLGRTAAEVVPELADVAEKTFRQVLQTGRMAHLEIRGASPARPGDVRVWDERWYPVRDAQGRIEAVGVVVEDITERKRAEEALSYAERRFRISQEASPIGFTILRGLRGPDGALVDFVWEYVNAAAGAILRRPAEQLVGKRLLQELPGNTDNLFATYARVVETGISSDCEVAYDADGIVGWFRNIAVKLDDGVAVSFTDMTARRRAEEAARLRNEQLQTLVDHAPLGVYMVDSDFRLAMVNPVAASFFADCRPPVEGRDFADVLREGWRSDYGEEVMALFRHTLATGEPYAARERPAPRKGERPTRLYDWTINRLALPEGRFGVVCYFREVTEQVGTREALAVAKGAAEAANAAKDRFLAVLSHELRTPLTPVVITAELMAGEPGLAPEIRERLELIHRNVLLEVKLIDDLLDLSRVTSGKLQLHRQPLELNQAVREACQTCAEPAREKGIRITCELDEACGQVDGDPARLQQVLWNLLRNAVKFTPARGGVVVRTARENDLAVIEVRDDGIGIPPEVLPKIFEAFEQGGEAVTKQFGGLGLGLAISKLLVEMHGGTIAAQSAGPGRGATFTVRLPAMRGDAASATRPGAGGVTGVEGAARRLLMVEDHADTAAVLARMLKRRGYEVRIARTAAEAVQLWSGERFDALVSDLGLPDGSGYELLQQLSRERAVPAIAMSGYGMEEDVRRSRQAGFAEHLVKPVRVDQLIAALRRVCGNQ